MLRASVYRVDRSGKWKRKEGRKKNNCLLKVLSIADRLIHSQINRPRTTRRATPSSFTLLFDHAPPPFPIIESSLVCPPFPPSLFPSRFFLGINNFYRPSGRRNGKRRRPFNFSRVWRVLRGFPLRKCKGRNTPCRDIVVTSTSRGRKQELTGAGNLVELMLRPANTTCRTTVNCINFTRKNIALTL